MTKKLREDVVSFSRKNREHAAELRCLRLDLQAVRTDCDTIWTGRDMSQSECGLIRVAWR